MTPALWPLLVSAVTLPGAGAVLAAALRSRDEWAGRVAAGGTAAAFLPALLVAVAVGAHGRVSGPLVSVGSAGAVLLLLVLGVGAVVQTFARRYLRGDAHAAGFFVATGALTTATAAFVCAGTILALAAAWSAAGAALCVLLGLYRGTPAADRGLAQTVRAFLVGDTALWLATGLAIAHWGNLDLARLAEGSPRITADPAVLDLVACLLVVAALARSAQAPFHRWLPATLAAPTPVSAVLHAGVVNAGGILLVRLAPLFGASPVATHAAFAAGAATAVYGTLAMLVRPDVKGGLAYSTAAQMGFMTMTCGLGAYPAVLFHLVAHAMYKATLFLGAGSAVRRHLRHAEAPAPPRIRPVHAAIAAAAPALALAIGALALPVHGGRTWPLLGFAWATGTWAAAGWLRRRPGAAGIAAAATGAMAMTVGYLTVLSALTALVSPSLPPAAAAVTPWASALVLALLALVRLVRSPSLLRRASGLHQSLYVWALGAGQPATGRPAAGRANPALVLLPAPSTGSAG